MKTLTLSNQQRASLDAGFTKAFGTAPQRYFSAPGRTELSGNHLDHQRGQVLAAAVDLDSRAAVRVTGSRYIRIQSQGYALVEISLDDLSIRENEKNTTASLVRGVAARFSQLGCKVAGFDAYVESTVLPGSGLSSSAAFEVLIGTMINCLFFEKKASSPQIAIIGQYAENVYFGKPSGLMDQMASSVGGLVAIDFADPENPVVNAVDFDFSACGHALCIIDSGADHAELTDEYAAITRDMQAISAHFGKTVLRQVAETDFYRELPVLRKKLGDRAVLRGMHFFAEMARVTQQLQALQNGDFHQFLALVTQSGHSSFMYLQNVIPAGAIAHQNMAISLALCEKLLMGRGAYRVHGGGFAGTILAFVPLELLEQFRGGIEAVLGNGACHVLSIRPQGGVELIRS